jgi:hypothetical protein
MPYNPLKANRRFGETASVFRVEIKPSKKPALPPALTAVYCSDYSSTLKMEATCFLETSVAFQRATRRYIPEECTLNSFPVSRSLFALSIPVRHVP